MRDALRDAGNSVALAVLRAPLSVCLARVEEREGEPSADPAALEQIWRSFADIGDFEANVIDLGEQAFDEVTETVARHLEDGRLLI